MSVKVISERTDPSESTGNALTCGNGPQPEQGWLYLGEHRERQGGPQRREGLLALRERPGQCPEKVMLRRGEGHLWIKVDGA